MRHTFTVFVAAMMFGAILAEIILLGGSHFVAMLSNILR